jgi:predicted type IV restriction endonuclease
MNNMTIETLSHALESIRNDRRILEYDEITTKQKIILQVLTILGWNIFSYEVMP